MDNIFIDKYYTNKIRELINAFSVATGIRLFVIDSEGKVVCSDTSVVCPFYKTSFSSFDTNIKCEKAHAKAGKIADSLGESYIFYCPHGLTHICTPIEIGDEYKGAIITQPLILGGSDELLAEEVATKLKKETQKHKIECDLGFMPCVSTFKAHALEQIMLLLSKELSEDSHLLLYEKNKNAKEQAHINEQIQTLKDKVGTIDISQFKDLQDKFLESIKQNDSIEARKLLNDILGLIFFNSGNNLEIIRIKVIELIALMVNAVQNSVNDKELIGLSMTFYKQALSFDNIDNLCEWMSGVLETLIKYVFKQDDAHNYLIDKAVEYVNNNYSSESISLSETAQYVYLSPSYFSRIFKAITNYNFNDYLNKVRINASLNYLADLKYELSDIAAMVGFSDQSYFSKVFKKFKKITPGIYRKQINQNKLS